MKSGAIEPPYLISALDGDDWSASRFCRFTPEETAPGTHFRGDGIGHSAELSVMERDKRLPLLGIQTRILCRPACSS
jgi:hypothetical protein